MFIRFTVRVLREPICECASFPFGYEGEIRDLIVLVPNYCFLFTFIFDIFCLFCRSSIHLETVICFNIPK